MIVDTTKPFTVELFAIGTRLRREVTAIYIAVDDIKLYRVIASCYNTPNLKPRIAEYRKTALRIFGLVGCVCMFSRCVRLTFMCKYTKAFNAG